MCVASPEYSPETVLAAACQESPHLKIKEIEQPHQKHQAPDNAGNPHDIHRTTVLPIGIT